MKKQQQAARCAGQMGQQCLAMRARLISRTISRIYDAVLRPHGLKGSQMSILAAIANMGRPGPSDLCEILNLELSTLSRNLYRMKKKGWLDISPGEDRRSRRLHLTEAGYHKIIDAFPAWQQAQARVENLLGETGAANLARVAGDLWAAL